MLNYSSDNLWAASFGQQPWVWRSPPCDSLKCVALYTHVDVWQKEVKRANTKGPFITCLQGNQQWLRDVYVTFLSCTRFPEEHGESLVSVFENSISIRAQHASPRRRPSHMHRFHTKLILTEQSKDGLRQWDLNPVESETSTTGIKNSRNIFISSVSLWYFSVSQGQHGDCATFCNCCYGKASCFID